MQCAICTDVSLLALPLGFMPRCRSAAPLGQLLQRRPSANGPHSWSIACRNTVVHEQTATVDTSPQLDSPSRLDGKELKLIGLGPRGANAVAQLLHGSCLINVGAWYIDTDAKAIEASTLPNKLLLKGYDGTAHTLPDADLQQVVGRGAQDQHGKGNMNAGDRGIAFIVASAGCLPGGSGVLVALARSLRAAGLFTAVVLTSPFDFEGARRLQAATSLVEQLHSTVHLVTVIEQNSLSNGNINPGGAPMTVAEATQIADNALEHSVRCVLAAVQATEILNCSQGALIWHGVEMRRFRRLLSPPLQHLLTSPGQAALGRGVAVMSKDLEHSMGECQALMHLASDAVRAAADSPFLEGATHNARSALCCVVLPCTQRLTGPETGTTSPTSWQHSMENAAARLAVQAAAGALLSICPLEDVIMFYTTGVHQGLSHASAGNRVDDGGQLRVEVSLLVLQNIPVASSSLHLGSGGKGAGGQSQLNKMSGPAAQGQTKVQRLPASSWGAISALAGGRSTSLGGQQENMAPVSAPGLPSATGSLGNASAQIPSQQGQALRGRSAAKSDRGMITVSAKVSDVESETCSVGGQLADNLIAQSLDLPPKAAKWRQSQRAKSERPRLMVQAPEAAWQAEDPSETNLTGTLRSLLGGPQQEFDVRERTFAILERDRGDAWEHSGLECE